MLSAFCKRLKTFPITQTTMPAVVSMVHLLVLCEFALYKWH